MILVDCPQALVTQVRSVGHAITPPPPCCQFQNDSYTIFGKGALWLSKMIKVNIEIIPKRDRLSALLSLLTIISPFISNHPDCLGYEPINKGRSADRGNAISKSLEIRLIWRSKASLNAAMAHDKVQQMSAQLLECVAVLVLEESSMAETAADSKDEFNRSA